MLIVSQDKGMIIDFEKIIKIEVINPLESDDGLFKVTATGMDIVDYELGKYKTEEEAKKVITEILFLYKQIYYNKMEKNNNNIYTPIYEIP